MEIEQIKNRLIDLADRLLPESKKKRDQLLYGILGALGLCLIIWLVVGGQSKAEKLAGYIETLNQGEKLDRELAIDELKKMPRDLVYPALAKALPGSFQGEFWGELGDVSRELSYSYVAKAILALGQPTDAALLELALNGDPDQRFYGAWMLGLVGDPQAIEPLIELLSDKLKRVRKRALISLLGFPQPAASEVIVKVIRRGSKHEFYGISLAGLCEVEREPYLELFQKLLKHPDRRARAALACLLAKQGQEENVRPLSRLYRDSSASVRRQAISAIEKIDPGKASSLIGRGGYKDKYWGNRKLYVEILCRLGVRENERQVRRYLRDPYRKTDNKKTRRGVVKEINYPVRQVAYTCLREADLPVKNVVLGKSVMRGR